MPRAELLEFVRGAHALLVHPPDRVDAELLDAAGPQLRVVGTMSVGLDHVDVAECRRRGIPVGFTPNVLTRAVAEMTVGLTLAAARRQTEALAAVRDGTWGTRWDSALYLCGQEVGGSTVGIVGLGRIGMAVAQRLKAFEPARMLYSGPNPKPEADRLGIEHVTFDSLLSQSDFVIATCAITAATKQLFGAETFGKMKSTAIFVNVTRGALVDQEALVQALKSGQIGGAALDVTTPEPLPLDSQLLKLPNCIVTPHLGSATVPTRRAMANLTVRNILAGLKGENLPSPAE